MRVPAGSHARRLAILLAAPFLCCCGGQTGSAGHGEWGEAGLGGAGAEAEGGSDVRPQPPRVDVDTGGATNATGGATSALGGEGGLAVDGGAAAAGAPSLPPAIAVAAGAFHSCALFEGGSVRCWGSSTTGGLLGTGSGNVTVGDDELPNVLGDVDVGGPVQSLSANAYHTCAVLQGGGVRCWGGNAHGRLGYPGIQIVGDDETPAAMGDVDVGGPVAQVVAGYQHTCARLRDGRVRCWGSNEKGQLGYAGVDIVGDDETPAAMGDVDLPEAAVDLALGWDFTCAVLASGKVTCWGETIFDPEPSLGGKAVQIAAAVHHVCVMLDTFRVRCWGGNHDGILGYGDGVRFIGDDETVAEAGDVPVGGDVLQITANVYDTCALLADGDVRCWGKNEKGELGYGHRWPIGDDETPAEAGDIELGARATSVSMGFLHACAVIETGRVRCWGRGGTGALGYGKTADIGDDEVPATAGDVETH